MVPKIPEHERTPVVADLLEIIQKMQEEIQALKDEIARLKGQKPKPKIKPSNMEKTGGGKQQGKSKPGDKRPGSEKRRKTKALEIHETNVIEPDTVPEGSRFKGYKDYMVQEIIIVPYNTLYRLERWQTPQGEYAMGRVPAEIHGHFGLTLVSFILYQYYHALVTQPLILEQLHEFGIDISAGQVNRIITEDLRFRGTSTLMTPVPGTKGRTDFAPTSATNCLPGFKAPGANRGSTFWSFFVQAKPSMSSTTMLWITCKHRDYPRGH